jgi:hypothetical protein
MMAFEEWKSKPEITEEAGVRRDGWSALADSFA